MRTNDVALLRLCSDRVDEAEKTWIDCDPDDPEFGAMARAEIASWWVAPTFREAVEVASPSLGETVDRIVDGSTVDRKRIYRCLISLAKYKIRMSHRPTPFGVMAGVAVATTESGPDSCHSEPRIGDTWHRVVRPDMTWVSALVERYERDPDVIEQLAVASNNLLVARGDRVSNPYPARTPGGVDTDRELVQELSLRRTAAVDFVLDKARGGISCRELADDLRAQYPEMEESSVSRFVATLIASEFLVSDLRPPVEVADPFHHLARRLGNVSSPLPAQLRVLAAQFEEYRQSGPEAGRDMYRELVSSASEVISCSDVVHVDLVRDVDMVLPRIVVEEVGRAVSAVRRMNPPKAEPRHLRAYRMDFLEYYGLEAYVPVTKVLDTEIGLGPPAGYQSPPGFRGAEATESDVGSAEGTDDLSRRNEILSRWVHEALTFEDSTLNLTEEMLDGIEHPSHKNDYFPSSECCFRLCAESLAAVRNGDFRLVTSQLVAQPGATFGRFLSGLEDSYPGTVDALANRYRVEDHIVAQLEYTVHRARFGNLTRHPRVLPKSIAIGTYNDDRNGTTIDLHDVAVHASTTGFTLHQISTGSEIRPISFTMLNMTLATNNVVRFLRELGFGQRVGFQHWNWGTLDLLPVLPRVVYGRSVLSPARWRPPLCLRELGRTFSDWQEKLVSWRSRYRVPARVQVVLYDHRIDLNLESVLHQHILKSELTKNPESTLQECPETLPNAVAWSDNYACELVVPVPEQGSVPDRRRSRPGIRSSHGVHFPGSEWIFANLYCASGRQDYLLSNALGAVFEELADGVDRWFFIRYRDPQPHLRLRLHIDSHADVHVRRYIESRFAETLSALCESGAASRYVLSGYRPESGRYGEGALLRQAEKHFMCDSQRALTTLRGTGGRAPEFDKRESCMLDMMRMCGALLGDRWDRMIIDHIPRSGVAEGDRDRQKTVFAAIDSHDGVDAPTLQWVASLDSYRQVYWRTAEPDRPGSLLGVMDSFMHMHHNRFIGIDSESERHCRAVVRSAALRRLSRAGRTS